MLKGISQHGVMPIFGWIFKVILLVVTALNTYGILFAISQDRVWAAAALILFEVGLIYWWMVFKNDTDASVIQMTISLLMFITCLLLVAAANALHLGAVSPDMLGEGTIPKVVIIAVVVHLAASLFYPLAGTDHMAALVNQIAIGLVWGKAQSNVIANIDRLAEQTQVEIEDRMWQTIRGRIHQTANDRLISAPTTMIEGQSILQTPSAIQRSQPARSSFVDRLFGRNHEEDQPVDPPPTPSSDDATHHALGDLTPAELRQLLDDLAALRQAHAATPSGAGRNNGLHPNV